MATPLYATVLAQINTYIVANGNNEITANVLNPVLKIMLDFANNNIGDLSTLTTDEKNSIVDAINSLKQNFDNLVNNGVQLHTGVPDPNDTPPTTYNYADFYMQLDSEDSTPVQLWQYNGFEWVDYSSYSSDNIENASNVPGGTVSDALDSLLENVTDSYFPKIQFTADGIQNTFGLSTEALAKAVFWNGAILDDADWSQSANILTLTFTPDAGAIIKPI